MFIQPELNEKKSTGNPLSGRALLFYKFAMLIYYFQKHFVKITLLN